MSSSISAPVSETPKRQAWKALGLLMATNVLMSVDRTIPQLVAEPVRMEFGLSDAQLGIFIGIAFGASYGVAGLLVGPLVDRYNRRSLLAAILSIWSAMTFMTGLASSYLWLLVTRAGLGAAEAGGNPAAISIIGDLFPPDKRSSAIGIYKIGVPVGIFLASLLVGLLATDYGWRVVFFVAGIPGFIVALLIWLTVKDPPRGAHDGLKEGGYEAVPYLSAVKFIFSDRSVMPLTVGFFLTVFAGASIHAFLAAFLQRFHDLSLKEVGLLVAIGAALSAISPVVVGLIADKVARTGKRSLLYYLALVNALTLLAALLMLTSGGVWLAIAGLLTWQFISMGLTTPGMAALILLSPVGMRGTLIAFVSVGNMFLGFGIGPVAVGFLSDGLDAENSLQLALIIVSISAYLLATAAFIVSARQTARQTAS